MIQKLIQVGNSTGIIIPKPLLDLLELNMGSDVKVETDISTKSLIIQNSKSAVDFSSITPHFLEVLENVNQEYASALRELALK